MHNAENALDYQGTYKGVFPAADCPGIEIELTLHNDNTYTMNSSYMDRSEEPNSTRQETNTVKGNLLTLRAKWHRASRPRVLQGGGKPPAPS